MWIFNRSLKFFVSFSAAKLPKKMQYGPRMSPSPDGSSVVLTYLKDIYKLNCKSGLQCTWELLPNKLQVSRQYHIQVTVPAVQNCWKIYMFECTYLYTWFFVHTFIVSLWRINIKLCSGWNTTRILSLVL